MVLTKMHLAEILFATTLALFVVSAGAAQQKKAPAARSEDIPEMLVTPEGFLAIDSPKNWVREEASVLAFFVPQGTNKQSAPVWIYVSSAPIGSKDDPKDLQEYIAMDIAGFKQQFKNGVARAEEPIDLPIAKRKALVYSFESGEVHNSFEQIVYVGEANRVLILVLSAKTKAAFDKALVDFRQFVQSYRGSITVTNGDPK
jgi:hypothetical protein